MTELDDIKAALRQAALDGIGPAARGDSNSPTLVLIQVVDRIAASILPRQITLRPASGQAITLVADSGRLHHIQSADRTIEMTVKSPDEAARVLRDFVMAEKNIQLRTHPTVTGDDARGRGVAARDLRRALDLKLDTGSHPNDPLEALVNSIPDTARVALAVTDAGFECLTGSDEDSTALADWAGCLLDTLFDEEFPMTSAFETHGTLRLGWHEHEDHHVLMAGRLGQIIVALMPGSPSDASPLGSAA